MGAKQGHLSFEKNDILIVTSEGTDDDPRMLGAHWKNPEKQGVLPRDFEDTDGKKQGYANKYSATEEIRDKYSDCSNGHKVLQKLDDLYYPHVDTSKRIKMKEHIRRDHLSKRNKSILQHGFASADGMEHLADEAERLLECLKNLSGHNKAAYDECKMGKKWSGRNKFGGKIAEGSTAHGNKRDRKGKSKGKGKGMESTQKECSAVPRLSPGKTPYNNPAMTQGHESDEAHNAHTILTRILKELEDSMNKEDDTSRPLSKSSQADLCVRSDNLELSTPVREYTDDDDNGDHAKAFQTAHCQVLQHEPDVHDRSGHPKPGKPDQSLPQKLDSIGSCGDVKKRPTDGEIERADYCELLKWHGECKQSESRLEKEISELKSMISQMKTTEKGIDYAQGTPRPSATRAEEKQEKIKHKDACVTKRQKLSKHILAYETDLFLSANATQEKMRDCLFADVLHLMSYSSTQNCLVLRLLFKLDDDRKVNDPTAKTTSHHILIPHTTWKGAFEFFEKRVANRLFAKFESQRRTEAEEKDVKEGAYYSIRDIAEGNEESCKVLKIFREDLIEKLNPCSSDDPIVRIRCIIDGIKEGLKKEEVKAHLRKFLAGLTSWDFVEEKIEVPGEATRIPDLLKDEIDRFEKSNTLAGNDGRGIIITEYDEKRKVYVERRFVLHKGFAYVDLKNQSDSEFRNTYDANFKRVCTILRGGLDLDSAAFDSFRRRLRPSPDQKYGRKSSDGTDQSRAVFISAAHEVCFVALQVPAAFATYVRFERLLPPLC